MPEPMLTVITEHVLHQYEVGPNNAPDVRLFRAPDLRALSGSDRTLPHEVTWEDLVPDDIVIAVEMLDGPAAVLPVVEVWRVISKVDADVALVWANRLVGKGLGAQDIVDRLRGLVRAEAP